MSRTFFFQQNDTKINDFDEGILIPEPFFWGNVIFQICSFCIKSLVRSREVFLWVAPPDCSAAKLPNGCFSLFMLASLYKARADTLPGEAKQWKILVRKLWVLRLKVKSWKWHCLRKTAIESKRLNQIKKSRSWCHLDGKRIFLYAIMHTIFSFCPSFSSNYWSWVLHSFWATLYIALQPLVLNSPFVLGLVLSYIL